MAIGGLLERVLILGLMSMNKSSMVKNPIFSKNRIFILVTIRHSLENVMNYHIQKLVIVSD
jgi:hypothetical protein